MISAGRGRPAHGALAVALAALALTAAPSAGATRQALIVRWARANHRPPSTIENARGAYPAPPRNLRALAERELASGNYHLAPAREPAPVQVPWWMRLWEWLRDRFVQLWRVAFGNRRLGREQAMVIGDVLIAGALGLIGLVLFRIAGELAFERRRRTGPIEPIPPPADAAALYAAACERARDGAYANAARLLFAATISALVRRGAIEDDRSATVGDFRRRLGQLDRATVPPFDDVSAAFVTGAYAECPVDASDWERARLGYLALSDASET